MARKCVAQMPDPPASAAMASQPERQNSEVFRA